MPKRFSETSSIKKSNGVHSIAPTLFSFGHTYSPHPEFGLALRHLNTVILAIEDFNLSASVAYDRLTVRQECDSLIATLMKLENSVFLRLPADDLYAAAEARALECARLAALGTCYRILRHFNETTVDQDMQESILISRLCAMEGEELPPLYVTVLLWALFMCGQNAAPADPAINRMTHRACTFLECFNFEDAEHVLLTFSYIRSVNQEPCARLWQSVVSHAEANIIVPTLEFSQMNTI